MLKRTNTLARLTILLTISLVTFAGGCPPTIIRRTNFFPPLMGRVVTEPPTDQLMLWLTGSQSAFELDTSGQVTNWHDLRGGTASAVEALRGQMISSTITTPSGTSRTEFGLRCGPAACSYTVFPGSFARRSLDGTPYTILAAVRRRSDRGHNYFVMTRGQGCDLVSGLSCQRNTALHVGWSAGRTVRLGQYGDEGREDVILDPTPAFDASASPMSIFVAVSGVGEGKTIALLEPSINDGNTATDLTPLSSTHTLYIGGTPFAAGVSMPHWNFEGDIFAILIYTKVLSAGEMRDAQDYLRNRYGPR